MYVRGGSLIGSDVHDTSVRFAHVVWLSHTEADTHIPANFQECVLSWEHCTGVQLVVWLNSDCLELLRLYSDNVSFYKTKLKSPVERSDYMRMIILHEFGGFYSDVDVWVQNDFVNHIDVSRPVALVRSPLVTEAFQSCLLVANTRHHPLWLDIVRRIENNVRSVECGSCGRIVYWLLRVPMLGRLVRTMLTVFITGPPNIDRCLALKCRIYCNDVQVLDERFYSGPIAFHQEAGSWTPFFRAGIVVAALIDRVKRVTSMGTQRVGKVQSIFFQRCSVS